jgi:hypothetical protein
MFFYEFKETSDEALVMTNKGEKISRELLKDCIVVNVKRQNLLLDIQLGYLTNKVKILKEKAKANQLFRIRK